MPFCTNCGTPVAPADTYCGVCGQRQAPAPAGGPPPPPGKSGDPLRNVTPRTASILCYVPIVGWIAAIGVLASPAFQRNRTIRFHAFQGIYLFVTYLLVDWVIEPILHAGPRGGVRNLAQLLHLIVFGASIWMIIKTSQDQTYSLPVLGELAERSVAEQR